MNNARTPEAAGVRNSGPRSVNGTGERVAALEAIEPKAERRPEAQEAVLEDPERAAPEPPPQGLQEAPAPKEVEWDLGL